jgi:hypothetical protein
MKIEEGVAPTWEQVDLALRSIAERRAGLDAEEARWLREAELLQVWRPLGMVSIFDYMKPERAHSDIPPAIRRLVWARDRGRCQVPGCRSTRGLDCHHLRHQEHGGGHEASNLALVCSSCHIAHHEGRITIGGSPGAITVERSHVGVKRVAAHVEAKDALVALGWKRQTAAAAVEKAAAEQGNAPLEQIIRSALRHCWQPETYAPS